MRALIYKSTGSWYIARGEDGQLYNARVKGSFKVEGLTSTNPIAVGDEVNLNPEDEADNVATITDIHDRRNYIARTSPHNKNKHHIVASNIDQTLLFATLKDPKTSQGFLDRFLVSAEAYHVPAILVFNKSDLFRKKEQELYDELWNMYTAIGYTVLKISLKQGEGIEELKTLLQDKTTLVSGHSGVGKSTFINHLFPDMELKTQEVSGWSGKGLHTTTYAEMFDLPFNGKIIDTPGIREFGLVDISRQELSHYFPEMRALLNNCQFNNCQHINEPGCAVKAAVESGEIAESRFFSYYNILESIDAKSY
ncbi:ribosome biogenesis GTPase [Filimonas lacunae]|uniref:Small ribosomal subunit biogenesis GTPase RsgA n=1 Tax=Filimonas lacunae TaxID=477680 RepID=A0A173MRP4_9BACT|nr:ribosome small subunit-dependent GTPase A [Filimonas lacunae]BAV10324.1 ribosome small subunit-stimulated GTPase EngC [Filimonas lacunae]SIT17068.1 ribosome biogenesis GTPase [Filimonas lacunae]